MNAVVVRAVRPRSAAVGSAVSAGAAISSNSAAGSNRCIADVLTFGGGSPTMIVVRPAPRIPESGTAARAGRFTGRGCDPGVRRDNIIRHCEPWVEHPADPLLLRQ